MKKVIITGVTGQDGSLMADYLLKNTDYQILGGVRRLSVNNHKNIDHINNPRFKIVPFELSDSHCIDSLISCEKPDYFINFAANSFVGNSWNMPVNHMINNSLGVLYILESLRKHSPNTRFYNAGSSEQWGDISYSPQDMQHPFKPRSMYGVSKCAAHFTVKVYRETYNLYAIQGLLTNHEGLRRGEEFVTRKITKGVARIYHSIKNNQTFEPICLGNLDAKRDWSDSEDFVDGIWKMLNQDKPKEYILSSNETHSVREFIEIAFKEAGIEGKWTFRGSIGNYIPPENETFETLDGKILIKIDPKFYRPCEVEILHGNSNPARQELGWTPKISFPELVARMVKNDINNYKS
ncbi:GDP-mannose 4,6-dehydratase [Flavobacterium sp.]|uniref:GDP-mannose 4,6-dehydratase n=1 Tax=Flavobacterium sp. TaxID=239 RepID=UPI0038FCE28E